MPTPARPDQMPIALPRSSAGKTFVMIESVAGMIRAAPTPMAARAAITSPADEASAPATDAAPKSVVPAWSARLRPKRSPSVPIVRRSPAKTSM
jgi:hypothetical protein